MLLFRRVHPVNDGDDLIGTLVDRSLVGAVSETITAFLVVVVVVVVAAAAAAAAVVVVVVVVVGVDDAVGVAIIPLDVQHDARSCPS